MVNRKTASVLTIAALLACAVPAKSMASALVLPVISSVLGQTAPTFPVPDSVAKDTEVVISSSSANMNAISEALGKGFEGEYDNSKVSITTKDANAAIQDVLNGNADLAAISRPLTPEETAKGLIAVPVRREKIAIVVNKDNPFDQSITGSQFAQIFRGEIKDWSEVGGTAGPIKLVDRPATSETRQALSPYPVFTTAPFNAATDATTVAGDATADIVKALGPDGISYVLVGELEGQSDLKALQLHKTPPSDPKYPFSQPYAFVYAGGASAEVSAFLGYATGNPGQAAINNAGVSGLGLIPDAGNGTSTANAGTAADTADSPPGTDSNATDTDATDAESKDTADTEDAVETPDETGNPDTAAEGATPDGATIEANNGMVAGPDGEIGTADDINIVGPDGVLGTADDIRGIGPDGEIGTADDIDLAGPDGLPGTADDVNLAGPDGEIGTADDVAVAGTVDAGSGLGNLAKHGKWWWLLLPLAGLGLLIWAAGKRSSEEETGYTANTEGNDRIRSSFDGEIDPNVGIGGVETGVSGAKVGGKGIGLGKVAAGGAAIAGGVAAAGAAGAGRIKNKAGDVTMDLQEGVSGSVKGGVEGIKGSVDGIKGGIGSGVSGLQGNIKGGVEGIKGGIGTGIDGIKGGVEGIKGKAQGSLDGIKGGVQGSVEGIKDVGTAGLDGVKGGIGSGIDGIKGAGTASIDGVKGGIDGIKGAGAASIDGIKGGVQGGVDGIKGVGTAGFDGVKGGIGSGIDGIKGAGAAGLGAGAAGLGAAGAGLSGLRDKAQSGFDNVRGNAQDGIDDVKTAASSVDKPDAPSWLDRAKQRINEATDQVKDTASDLKDDITKND